MSNIKKCSRCGKEKCKSNFGINNLGADGLRSYCKDCANEYNRKWYAENTEKGRAANKASYNKYKDKREDYRLKRLYNISLDQYNDMFSKQKGECAICGNKDEEKALAVDHCHDTDKVRELLCTRCNRAIGLFEDDFQLIYKAAAYLEKHNVL